MWRFIAYRVASLVPVLLLVSVLIFALVHLMPGDPAVVIAGDNATDEQVARISEALGLDRPLVTQYVEWFASAIRGDLGQSLFTGVDVTEAVTTRIPVTASLSALSLAVAIVVGVTAGMISALRPGGLADRVATFGSSLGLAMPNFWVGLLLVITFSLNLGWFPATGYVGFMDNPIGWLRSLVLPAVALGTSGSAILARQTRSGLIDVLDRDYIRAVRARGMTATTVVAKHALKNAAIPIVTVLGLLATGLLAGAVIVEQVFALPGVGTLAITAVNRRDIPMIQGVVMFTTLMVLFVNLVVDICYALLNPKVRPS